MTDASNTALIVSMVFAAATVDDKRISAVFTLIFLFISYLSMTEQSGYGPKDSYPSQKSPAEEAYREIYGDYPMGEPFWIVFKKGYEAAGKSKVKPSMINCFIEGNPPNAYSSWYKWFEELGSKGILHNLRISSKDFKKK